MRWLLMGGNAVGGQIGQADAGLCRRNQEIAGDDTPLDGCHPGDKGVAECQGAQEKAAGRRGDDNGTADMQH